MISNVRAGLLRIIAFSLKNGGLKCKLGAVRIEFSTEFTESFSGIDG